MTCQECQAEHRLIVMIEPAIWEKIAPLGGILCLACIEKALRQHGLRAKAQLSYKSDVIDAVDQQCITSATFGMYYDDARRKHREEIAQLRAELSAK